MLVATEAQTAKPSTISRRVAAIRYAHKLAGIQTPTDGEGVKATMRGIRRTFGGARNKKAPAVAAKMLGMVATAPDSLAGAMAIVTPWRDIGHVEGYQLRTARKPKPAC